MMAMMAAMMTRDQDCNQCRYPVTSPNILRMIRGRRLLFMLLPSRPKHLQSPDTVFLVMRLSIGSVTRKGVNFWR